MDLPSLPSVELGQVTLLELTWPWAPGGTKDPVTCVCYVVMKRGGGFVLCLPLGFLPAEALPNGMENEAFEGLGPRWRSKPRLCGWLHRATGLLRKLTKA